MTIKQIILSVGVLIFISGLLKSFGVELPDLRSGYSEKYVVDMFMGVFFIVIGSLISQA